jgi:hypothetical protein
VSGKISHPSTSTGQPTVAGTTLETMSGVWSSVSSV